MREEPRFIGGAPGNAIHLVRTAQQAQYQLSQMADQKASMLMAATFVIFTITIGQAKGGLPPLPLLVLGGFAFVAAVFAILAVLPSVSWPKPGGAGNPLFFGTFGWMEQDAFLDQLLDTLADDETIYRTMGADMYQNGRVLARKKYRMLGYAYRALLAGLTASLLTFVGQHLL